MKLWRSMVKAAVRLARCGMVSSLGVVLPKKTRTNEQEWDRWYRLAVRRTTPVKAFRRPRFRIKQAVAALHVDMDKAESHLKVYAIKLSGGTAEDIEKAYNVAPVTARRMLSIAERKVGKLLVNRLHQSLQLAREERSMEVEMGTW